MYCKDCRYDLRGLEADRCPECGREFDPADARTYDRFSSRIRGLVAPGIGARATIAFLVLLIWSMTVIIPGSITGVLSGPFVLVHVWDWWPWNVVTVGVGICVLVPAVLWVVTERTATFRIAIVTAVLSIAFSIFVMLKLMLSLALQT